MLNFRESESTNSVMIAGILKELDITETKSSEGKEYVSCKATVKVDQEVNGKMTENEIPVRMFAMRKKKDGTNNKLYDNIVGYKEKFTALAACPEDNPGLASKVVINSGKIDENIWIDANSGEVRSNFQISTNFLNEPRGEFEQGATFELSGVVLNKARETDSNEEETGRLKVKFAVVGYKGRVDVINLIAASDNAVNFIESNWEDGDTVNLTGAISYNQSTKTWFEEQGFGEPIKRTKTETRKELVILGGSEAGLEETYAYDADDIKTGLAERQNRVEEMKNKTNNNKRTQTSNKKFDF